MAQLVGRKRLDFTSSEGQRVNGVKLQMLVKDSAVEGLACDMPFIAADSPAFKRSEPEAINSLNSCSEHVCRNTKREGKI